MTLRKEQGYSDDQNFSDFDYHEDAQASPHKKRVRQMLEDRLDRKRLKEELDDFDGELEDKFDWDEIKR